jgi:DNA repair protein radC
MKLLEPSAPTLQPQKKSITELDINDRPREKFMTSGGSSLSAAELLAILVGSGNDKENAVTLMQRILSDCNGQLTTLGKRSIEELCAYHGIGPAKAVTILAACELGARRGAEGLQEEQFNCSEKLYRFFYEKLHDLPIEEAHVLLLNHNLRFIRSVMVARGGIDGTTIDIRVILREALVSNAVHIALCHNHPSGYPEPSAADDVITQQLKRACREVDLWFIDHIILADTQYYSYADQNRL